MSGRRWRAGESQVPRSNIVWSRGRACGSDCSQGKPHKQCASSCPPDTCIERNCHKVRKYLWHGVTNQLTHVLMFCARSLASAAREGQSWKRRRESLRKWVAGLREDLAPLAPALTHTRSCFLGGRDGEACAGAGASPECEARALAGLAHRQGLPPSPAAGPTPRSIIA